MKEKLSEIIPLLHYSKTLIKSGYIQKLKAKKLIRECRLIGEEYKDSWDPLEKAQAEAVLEAVKEISYWLHEYMEENIKNKNTELN